MVIDLHRQTVLINHSQALRSRLEAVTEESPPRASSQSASRMETGSRPDTAASGSKRKRDKQDYDFRSGRLDSIDLDGQTPKRSRSHARFSDNDASDSNDETPAQNRSVRRRKGAHNLSAMNLRHAAPAQVNAQRNYSPTRESRFQEGSLTDKPSAEPPSLFTRLPHTDSSNFSYDEELMEDYQEGTELSTGSIEAALHHEKDNRTERVTQKTTHQGKEEGGGIFRFGRSLATNFHPVTLWNRLWNEQKDEMTRQAMLEAERKAKLKAQAEAKYAELKYSGQLGLQPVTFADPRDSGVAFGDDTLSRQNGHAASLHRDRLMQDLQREGSEISESASKPFLRSARSRFHLRKPSLQNLQQSIKRVASYANVRDQPDRESSSSLSPTKGEYAEHTLLKSASKYDLKRQHKLSKRVSDLEAKLHRARSDLDLALVQASPAPQLGNKFQRFTPSGTLRKPRFVPGALPTLPSEGVLFPSEHGMHDEDAELAQEGRTRIVIDPQTAFDNLEEEETIKAPRGKSYPARARDLFSQSGEGHQQSLSSEQHKIEETLDITEQTDAQNESPTALLDAKLQALQANVKASKKSSKSRKRSLRAAHEQAFKPSDEDDDDDAEWDEATQHSNKKKKRYGEADLESSPAGASSRNMKVKSGSEEAIRIAATAATTGSLQNGEVGSGTTMGKSLLVVIAAESEDELTKMISRRTSIASEDVVLEPVYEEEEETSMVPLKDAPSKPTAKATPARFGYNAVRSRSTSPHKRVSAGAGAGTEERVMARAASAAQRKRSSRSVSPNGQAREATAVGKSQVSQLSAGGDGTVKRIRVHENRSKENFEWPEDVF